MPHAMRVQYLDNGVHAEIVSVVAHVQVVHVPGTHINSGGVGAIERQARMRTPSLSLDKYARNRSSSNYRYRTLTPKPSIDHPFGKQL